MGHPSTSLTDLTASILARTSGSACGRLRALACDIVDGTLPPDDRDLAHLHLAHCPHCQGLITRLEMACHVLPAFARLEPGTGFTGSVLSRIRLAPPFQVPPQDRLLVGWARLMRRPRAALEAAYLATAAGLVLTQVPLPGAQGSTGSALVSLVRTESRASLAKAGSRGHAWVHRTGALDPPRILRPPEPVWSTLWSRLTRRIGQVWLDLAKAARQVRARAWPEQPKAATRSTEPSEAASRPAL